MRYETEAPITHRTARAWKSYSFGLQHPESLSQHFYFGAVVQEGNISKVWEKKYNIRLSVFGNGFMVSYERTTHKGGW